VAGGTIKARLDAGGGKLPEAEAAAVMRGVLDVLVECHRREIAYADVKPANFLVAGSGDGAGAVSVRAVDFGCSRRAPLTQACGSPLYIAPELLAQRRSGVAVDVWAAGVMLYQMLTGRLPFWSNLELEQVAALPPWSILAAVRSHEIGYPRPAWRGVSPEAKRLVASMLQRDPGARISAAEALAHPWFERVLGFTPQPSSGRGRGCEEGGEEEVGVEEGGVQQQQQQQQRASNVVEFTQHIAAMHL